MVMLMQVTYPTTRVGWYDSRWTIRQKWLQQKRSPSAAYAGLTASNSTTEASFTDTRKTTLDKILQKLQ